MYRLEKIKLFCLPYAGGSSFVYQNWRKYLNENIELIPIELAGRGKRFREPLMKNIEDVVNDIYNIIAEDLEDATYAFYGHSMGTLLVYELCHKVLNNGHVPPLHAFFSGRLPPHLRHNSVLHKMEDDELLDTIWNLGGTPKGFFQDPGLIDIYLPILRADCKVVETHEYKEKTSLFNFGISIINGEEDELTNSKLSEWSIHTTNSTDFYWLTGGHFFIHHHYKKVTEIINNTLSRYIVLN